MQRVVGATGVTPLTDDQELAIRNAKLAQLETPFPPEAIGQIPKGGVKLDYVGHAAVTKRLLQVDPGWTWEPLAMTPAGLPMFDQGKGLWIRLTICGVTRLGYGDGDSIKECIGDAIRNAAMRFGVALDLWAKEDLSGIGNNVEGGSSGVSPIGTRPSAGPPSTSRPEPAVDGEDTAGSGEPSGVEEPLERGGPPVPPPDEPHEHVPGQRLASGKALCIWEDSHGSVCGKPFDPKPTVLTAPVQERADLA
jgi:hypothetical protein